MADSPHSVPDAATVSLGMQRQFEIYQLGLGGKKLSVPIPVSQLEKKAAEALSPQAYDYIAGSASGERTARANLAAFDRWRIVPRMLRDVSQRNLTVELFGRTLPAPVLLGPVGVQNIIHPEAELAVGRAAASLGLPFVLSTVSSRPIEEVGKAMAEAPHWFQLYWGKDHELTANLLLRAEKSGYTALVVTLDTAMLGWEGARLAASVFAVFAGARAGELFHGSGVLFAVDASSAGGSGCGDSFVGIVVFEYGAYVEGSGLAAATDSAADCAERNSAP